MLASPGGSCRSNWQRRVLRRAASPRGPTSAHRHLRLERQRGAVDRLEVGGEVGHGALVADPLRVDRERRAVGRVDREVRLVDVDLDRAHPDRDAADDRRHGVGDGGDVGVERVDVEGDPDDDDAVVVGPGERRGDRDQGERRALEGAGEVHPPDRVEGVAARPGGDVRGADLARGGAARLRPARRGPSVLRGGRDRGLRAVGDAAQVAGKPGRHREVEVAEELVAVVAVELQGEGAEVAGHRVRGTGHEARVEGAHLRPGRASRRGRSRAEARSSSLWSATSVPGEESGFRRVDRAVGRSRHRRRDRRRRGGCRSRRTAAAAGPRILP